MISERSELGRGVIFSALHFEEYNKVAKFTAFPWEDLHNPETKVGSRFLQRMEHDHQLIKGYLGEELIRGTHIVATTDLWWIVQDFYPESPVSNLHPQNEELICQLEDLVTKSKRMLTETGFSLDWLGFGMWGQMPKVLTDKYFWTIPSLTAVNSGNQPAIRLQDTGLLWTENESMPDVMVLPHEYLAWKGNGLVLKMMQKRVGINFFP